MEYLVCQYKDEQGERFITTRVARQTMKSVIIDMGGVVDSIVLETFPTYEEALNYKKGIDDADKLINDL